jgi:uncharacterized membrane protein YtjA (UPF0391 family)
MRRPIPRIQVFAACAAVFTVLAVIAGFMTGGVIPIPAEAQPIAKIFLVMFALLAVVALLNTAHEGQFKRT